MSGPDLTECPHCGKWSPDDQPCTGCGAEQDEESVLRNRIAELEAELAQAKFSSPSACADPVRLARISPETVRAWLHSRGWRWFGSRAMAIPAGRRSTYEIALKLGVTLRVLTIAGDALDLYPGQVLAELEAMQDAPE